MSSAGEQVDDGQTYRVGRLLATAGGRPHFHEWSLKKSSAVMAI